MTTLMPVPAATGNHNYGGDTEQPDGFDERRFISGASRKYVGAAGEW